jgi:peptidyl-prolyl cis-trans isomerase D
MEKFRNLTNNIFFKIFLSFVGLSFITFGISDLVFESNNSWVAKVNGAKISQINFARELENKKSDLYSKNPTPELLEYVNSDNFRNIILQRVVSEEILKNLISEMDLDLNSDLAIKQILDQEEFKDPDGSFNKLKFQSFLRINNLNSDKYLDELNFKIASNIIFSALDIQNNKIDPNLLIKKYQFQNQDREISLLRIYQSNVKNYPKITVPDLKNFYENNKNKYKSDELRKISFISIPKDSLISDIVVSKEEILLEYKNNSKKYLIPEKRKLYNMFVTDLSEAESFLNRIDQTKDIKSQFKKIAKESFDKEESEILINVSKKQLPNKISNNVFQLRVNEVSDVLQSDYGYHIVYLHKITPEDKQPIKDVEKQIKNKLFKVKSDKIIKEKISFLEDEIMILDNISDFKKQFPFSKVDNLPLMNINLLSDKGKKIKNNQLQNIIEDIFFLDENQFSEVISDDKNYYLAFVSKIIDERQKTFEEAKNQIRRELLVIKKQEALSKLAQKIATEIKKNPENIHKIAKKYKIKISKNINLKRENKIYPKKFLSEVFSLKKNEVSNAIKTSDAYFIAQLNDIILPKKDKINQDKLDKLELEYRDDIYSEIWLKLEGYLQNKYQVEVKSISSEF